MSDVFQSRGRRRRMASLLALVQVYLLLVAAVHHHHALQALMDQSPKIHRPASSMPFGDQNPLFCPICQAVRYGGSRPALAACAWRPDRLVSPLPLSRSTALHFRQRSAVCGRAPPWV